jgi:transposase-like protein
MGSWRSRFSEIGPGSFNRSLSARVSDEAATKLICLALGNITKKWQNPLVTWELAATQFAIQFGERFFAADAA